jgi:hypothetical protein
LISLSLALFLISLLIGFVHGLFLVVEHLIVGVDIVAAIGRIVFLGLPTSPLFLLLLFLIFLILLFLLFVLFLTGLFPLY